MVVSQPRLAVPSQATTARRHSTNCPLPGCGSVLPRSKPAGGSTRSVPRRCPRPGATSSSWLGVWCPRVSPGLAACVLCWRHVGLLSHTPSAWWAAGLVPRRWAGLRQGQSSPLCRRCPITAWGLPAGLPVPALLLTCRLLLLECREKDVSVGTGFATSFQSLERL